MYMLPLNWLSLLAAATEDRDQALGLLDRHTPQVLPDRHNPQGLARKTLNTAQITCTMPFFGPVLEASQ